MSGYAKKAGGTAGRGKRPGGKRPRESVQEEMSYSQVRKSFKAMYFYNFFVII